MSLRAGLLAGCRIAMAGDSSIAQRLRSLDAEPVIMPPAAHTDEDAAAAWVQEQSPLSSLVYDGRPGFGAGGHAHLRATLDEAWICARAVATGAMIDAEAEGRLLFVAPAPGAGPLARSARSGLESLARTLSVEWARHAVTAVAVCPGDATTEAELAELTAFLLSPAGGYYSGCRFDLGRVAAPS